MPVGEQGAGQDIPDRDRWAAVTTGTLMTCLIVTLAGAACVVAYLRTGGAAAILATDPFGIVRIPYPARGQWWRYSGPTWPS